MVKFKPTIRKEKKGDLVLQKMSQSSSLLWVSPILVCSEWLTEKESWFPDAKKSVYSGALEADLTIYELCFTVSKHTVTWPVPSLTSQVHQKTINYDRKLDREAPTKRKCPVSSI